LAGAKKAGADTGMEGKVFLTHLSVLAIAAAHDLDRVGCRVAYPARNRLVVEALHVLQGEFASRDVTVDLLDYAVMIDQGASDIQRFIDGFGK
jgi:hypothetical protein